MYFLKNKLLINNLVEKISTRVCVCGYFPQIAVEMIIINY